MTPKEMHFEIKRAAALAINTGWTVDISETHPYVGVRGPHGEEHWFEGQEAGDLIREAEKCAETFDCRPWECMLWYAKGW